MVDYVAVLRRTIDALPKNTPEIRTRVYDKARMTVQSKLAMINPPPSEALIAKQMSGLEAAIGTVEADFAVALEDAPAPEPAPQAPDALADILGAFPAAKAPETKAPEPKLVAPQPVAPKPPVVDVPDRSRLPETATLDLPEVEEAKNTLASARDSFDNVFGDLPQSVRAGGRTPLPDMPTLDDPVVPPTFNRAPKPKAKRGGVLVPLLGLAVLGGAGYWGWTERDKVMAFAQSLQDRFLPQQAEAPAQPTTPQTPPATTPATTTPATPETAQAPATEPAAGAPQKFTQRLNVDGTEVDAGAGTSGGEQSVAQLEPAATPPAETPAAETPAAGIPAAETPAATPPAAETPVAETPAVEPPAAQEPAATAEAVPVGQKAIFYEERTSGADGSVRNGGVVWSVVRESPGNDRPPEPAVRGDLSIPEAGLNVRLTLRRNADATLPASHILELIMTVPDDFAGGTIEDVQRVNLKPSEADAGAALRATPVKVADKFFLVALENNPDAIKGNLALLKDQSWIDLPVVYRSGRRALFTMEKGLLGDKVFKEVLAAWDAAPLQ